MFFWPSAPVDCNELSKTLFSSLFPKLKLSTAFANSCAFQKGRNTLKFSYMFGNLYPRHSQDSSHCFSHLTKRIAFDWQSLNFDSAKPQHRYIKSAASWHQLSPGVDGTCPSDFPKESNPCVTLFNASFVLVLILCPAMGLCDSWIAVSRKDATRCHLQEIQHLQAQAMSQKPQLWESNLCTEQEKQVCRSNAFYSEKSQWDEGNCIVKIHDKKERMQIYRLKPTPFLFF